LAIHTWPEFRYASVDLFTCGIHLNPWIGFEYLREKLRSRKWVSKEIIRGTMEEQRNSFMMSGKVASG